MHKIVLLFLLICRVCYADDYSNTLLDRADELYNERKKEEAKSLYIEAAEQGNPAANFALANKYSIENEKNYKIAALSGHEKGLEQYLDEVFFRAGTIEKADPDIALKVYLEAKKANPEVKIFNERKAVDTLNKCVEAGALNLPDFISKYGANVQDPGWKWANVVSKESTDSKLTLQLICRGGVVPAELQWAVRDYYKIWLSGTHSIFDGCSYAQAKLTMAVCSRGGY
jgi:TPR repeat protein